MAVALGGSNLCEHCGQLLRWPPTCCQKAMQDYSEEMSRLYAPDSSYGDSAEYDPAGDNDEHDLCLGCGCEPCQCDDADEDRYTTT